jgi:hypothetical protein
MWQDYWRPCAVFTATSEGFAPYYLAEIRHDLSQTTVVLSFIYAGAPPRHKTANARPRLLYSDNSDVAESKPNFVVGSAAASHSVYNPNTPDL